MIASETVLREQLATCTRIFAMQGLIGLFGHVTVYQPESKRVFISPGIARDKATTRPEDLLTLDLDGRVLDAWSGLLTWLNPAS